MLRYLCEKKVYQSFYKTNQVFEGTSTKQPRALSCSIFVNSKMEMAVGRLYVQKYFREEAKNDVIKIL